MYVAHPGLASESLQGGNPRWGGGRLWGFDGGAARGRDVAGVEEGGGSMITTSRATPLDHRHGSISISRDPSIRASFNQASVQSRGSAHSVDCARGGIAQNPQSFPGEVARAR
jgi:hypothetical protein